MGGGEGRSSLGRQEGVPADVVRGKEEEWVFPLTSTVTSHSNNTWKIVLATVSTCHH